MKKSYLMMAAAATMLAACSQSDFVNDVPESAPQAIGFENHIGKSTRAAITSVDDLKNANGGFTVWGYKSKLTTPDWGTQATVFNGKNVTWTGSAWTYSPLQYWDKTATYKFYAAAPAGDYSIDSATGFVTISDVESAKYTESKDYLVTRGAKTQDGTNTNTIKFDLHHTMTKVVVKLQRTTDADITVTSLSMSGWDNALGTFAQNSDATPDNATDTDEWTLATPAVAGDVNFVGNGCTEKTVVLNSSDAVTVSDYYIMVPQEIAANTLAFTLSYTINGQTFTDHIGTLADKQIWGTDVCITYTVKVGPAAISFDVNSICNWCREGSGELPIE
jgi:hypothetical protein